MSMGITQMTSLLSSQNTLQNISNLNASRVALNGSSRVLASEIEIDKGRGVDTRKKEEELTQMEEGLDSTIKNMGSSIAGLNERIAADSEKIREEEAEQERQTKKVDEKPTTDKAEKASGTTSISTTGKTEVVASGITEPVDVVEISPEGKEAAAAHADHIAHKPAAAPRVHVQAGNKVIDKKV